MQYTNSKLRCSPEFWVAAGPVMLITCHSCTSLRLNTSQTWFPFLIWSINKELDSVVILPGSGWLVSVFQVPFNDLRLLVWQKEGHLSSYSQSSVLWTLPDLKWHRNTVKKAGRFLSFCLKVVPVKWEHSVCERCLSDNGKELIGQKFAPAVAKGFLWRPAVTWCNFVNLGWLNENWHW